MRPKPSPSTARKILELLKYFMRGRRRPVIVVLDRHPAHIARIIAQYVTLLSLACHGDSP
jgi:hypothetical protein